MNFESAEPNLMVDKAMNNRLSDESLELIKQGSLVTAYPLQSEQSQDFFTQVKVENADNCSAVLKGSKKPSTLEQLSKSSNDELACVYRHSSAGKMPDGSTDGRAIFMPGTAIGKIFSDIDNKIWAGKVFDLKTGSLVNRILGQEIVKAELSRGPSWLDGKQSTIIDYKNTSLIAGFLRDEIREVRPGLYLGIAYARLPFNQSYPALYFALESKKTY